MEISVGFDYIKGEDIPQMCEWALKEANPFDPLNSTY